MFVADATLGTMRRVMEANPQLGEQADRRTELISYLDADGRRPVRRAALPGRLPEGHSAIPTVFIIYEDFFDDTWDVVANLLAAHGYAVVKPSVELRDRLSRARRGSRA